MEYVVELSAGAEVTFDVADVWEFDVVPLGPLTVVPRGTGPAHVFRDGEWTRWYLREERDRGV